MMKEPSYRSTRRYLWTCAIMAWLIILILAVAAALGSEQAVAFGTVAVPSMVGMIVGILGVHRGFGSMDFRAQVDALHDGTEGKTP